MNSKHRILNLGIIGLAHLHPRLYMPLFGPATRTRAQCVMEENEALRESFCRDFNVRGYGSLGEMLKKETLDAAAIFLPHDACPDAAVKCAARGLHLMVEKPAAATSAGANRIVTAARKAGVKLTTGYCWRLHPVAREFRRLIDEGAIGMPIGAEGRCAAGRIQRYIDAGAGWMLDRRRSGGGPLCNLGVHWIDLFRWLLRDEAVEASGRTVRVNTQYNIEDNAFAQVRFSRGALLALDISYTVPDAYPHGRDLYLAVRGTRGVISWSPAFEGERDVLQVCSDAPGFAGSPNRALSFQLEPVPGYAGFMGREYVAAFAVAVLDGAEPPVTGEDALAALKIVEAIYRSDAEKRWVKISKSSFTKDHEAVH